MRERLLNPNLKGKARNLRHDMTEQEDKLWKNFLSRQSVHFRRQVTIKRYIVDFYCARKKLVIEIDGSQHFEKEGEEKDKERDEFLRSKGYKVLRYSNYDVNHDFEAVCIDIMHALGYTDAM